MLADAPLVMDSCTDVREQVLCGNEHNAARKRAMIRHHGGLVRFADEATDWAFNEALRKGDFCYRLYCFAKK